MTPRTWNTTTERLHYCEGSGRPAVTTFRGVGICRGCGVRTFVTAHGLVKPHKASGWDVVEFRRRGPRQARRGL